MNHKGTESSDVTVICVVVALKRVYIGAIRIVDIDVRMWIGIDKVCR